MFFRIIAAFVLPACDAAPAMLWENRTIYQLVTDRYARSDGSIEKCNSMYGPSQDPEQCPYGNYCGGTFKGIENDLTRIRDMGFDAIWISPVVENTVCGYHGYAAKNLEKINPRFGGEDGLKSLTAAAHDLQMYVMVDVVFNHMGWDAATGNTSQGPCEPPFAPAEFEGLHPFNTYNYFHPKVDGSFDYLNITNVTRQWMGCFADIKTDDTSVRETLFMWVEWLIAEFAIDGLRIDTIPYVEYDFWSELTARISSHTFATGEANAGPDFDTLPCNLSYHTFCPTVQWYSTYLNYQGQRTLESILNYPMVEALRPAFGMDTRNAAFTFPPRSMTIIRDRVQTMRRWFPKESMGLLLNFVDNHDVGRFLFNQNSSTLLKNALVIAFNMQGIPVVYYGTEYLMNTGATHSPHEQIDSMNANRWPLWMWSPERQSPGFYSWLRDLIAIRKQAIYSAADEHPLQLDYLVLDHVYVFLRGQVLFGAANVGKNVSQLPQISLGIVPAWGFNLKRVVCEVLQESQSTEHCMTVEQLGQQRLPQLMPLGEPMAWVPEDLLHRSSSGLLV